MIYEFKVARVSCDECGQRFPIIAPKVDLRARLKAQGWTVGPGWRVTCPECGRETE